YDAGLSQASWRVEMITGEKDGQGNFLLDLDDPSELRDVAKEFLQTETGREYKDKYYTKERSDDDLVAGIALARKRTGREQISINELRYAFEILMSSNVIPRKEEE